MPAYDYLPLLDEMDYVPSRLYAKGPEIFAHCQAIAKRYDLYDLAVFRTTVLSTTWDDEAKLWRIEHRSRRRHAGQVRHLRQRHAVQAKAVEDRRHGELRGPLLPHLALGLRLHRRRPRRTCPTRWSASSAPAPRPCRRSRASAKAAKELYVFQRTPSGIDIRNDRPTDPEWMARLQPGWQQARRDEAHARPRDRPGARRPSSTALSREEKIRRQENDNIDHMMRIHARIDEIVQDKATADALKPWYMFMCKRPCFDDDYLPTYNLPNVHLVDTQGKGITEIAPEGPVFEGQTYPLDLLIYATGFEVQKTGIYNEIRGRDGREINETYADGMRTLFGVHTHGYPEPVHHGRLPGLVPVQPHLHAADPGRPHRRVHRAGPRTRRGRDRRHARRPRNGGCRR